MWNGRCTGCAAAVFIIFDPSHSPALMNISTSARLFHFYIFSVIAMDIALTLAFGRLKFFNFYCPLPIELLFWSGVILFPVMRLYLKDKHLAWWLAGGLYACRLMQYMIWHGFTSKEFIFTFIISCAWALLPFAILTGLWFATLHKHERDEWGG
jgi:hypothetical protein